ncbi:MAG: transcriptional repressor [Parabacteroides sp.]|nr:transcriptional repressor [Parabacteroides sp.]
MKNDDFSALLVKRDIQPTPVRVLIFKAMSEYPGAFSLSDLETRLETVDKSTISRTIHLFLGNLMLHSIDDGSGSNKYALCQDNCHCRLEDMHLHFHCSRCNRIYCLKETPIPAISLPEGFILENGNFVLKGICPTCSKSAT